MLSGFVQFYCCSCFSCTLSSSRLHLWSCGALFCFCFCSCVAPQSWRHIVKFHCVFVVEITIKTYLTSEEFYFWHIFHIGLCVSVQSCLLSVHRFCHLQSIGISPLVRITHAPAITQLCYWISNSLSNDMELVVSSIASCHPARPIAPGCHQAARYSILRLCRSKTRWNHQCVRHD